VPGHGDGDVDFHCRGHGPVNRLHSFDRYKEKDGMADQRGFQYHARDTLRLREVQGGAEMWAVSLVSTMLSYFEVQPNTRFERHRHDSEQITMVLKGVLHFEVDGECVAVGQGDVIALPANIDHAVFTEGDFVQAVDAWSPVINLEGSTHK
jgi:mannose-6-phosphate isomerase-like protein (cupin superfamily)